MPASTARTEPARLDALERRLQRLAFDLHDGLLQSLSAARLQADVIASLSQSPACDKACRELKAELGVVLHDVRVLVGGLRPAALDEDDLETMIRRHAERVGTAGLHVEVHVDGVLPSLSRSARTALFRIVQEALNNVLEHARATRAFVFLACPDGWIKCSVTDAGCGFDPERRMAESPGLGLPGMRERARLLGGDVVVRSISGRGTEVIASIPIWS